MIALMPRHACRNTEFQTARTRKFRANALSEEGERTISHVEEFGCSVVSVKPTKYGFGWSYTVGLFDTSGRSEIITVGLLPDTALFALNEAVSRSEEQPIQLEVPRRSTHESLPFRDSTQQNGAGHICLTRGSRRRVAVFGGQYVRWRWSRNLLSSPPDRPRSKSYRIG